MKNYYYILVSIFIICVIIYFSYFNYFNYFRYFSGLPTANQRRLEGFINDTPTLSGSFNGYSRSIRLGVQPYITNVVNTVNNYNPL